MHHDISALPPDAFLRLPQVLAVVGLSRSCLYARIKNQGFPRQVKLTARASGWRVSDIREWLSNPAAWAEHPKTS